MKQLLKLSLLMLAMLLPTVVSAHDFKVDGIYYNITSDNEVAVTYGGASNFSAVYSGDVVIPETVTYNGTTFTVTAIGNSAFLSCYNLTSITLPNSVTAIGESAFSYCEEMTGVVIPNSVTSIGNLAFNYCSGLTCVTIPNSVAAIGDYAFYNCTSLDTLNFNAVSCADFNSFYYPFKNTNISTINIGDAVQKLPASFASGLTKLTSVTIPNSVTTIGSKAFEGCSKLTGDFTLSKFVTSIGSAMITGCNELSGITVASDNPVYDSRNNCNAIIETASNELICGCNNTVIPSSVTSIGFCAFEGFTKFTSIIIPNSVTSIGGYAFEGCTGLTNITIPSSVTEIGSDAFAPCSGLSSLTVDSGNPIYDSRDNCNAIIQTATNTLIVGCKNTVIPNSVTAIGYHAFYCCTGLTSIDIPNSVTYIDWSVFRGCTGLTSITIPNSVTDIGGQAFYGCTSLTSVTIPNSVTRISYSVFGECTSLTSVTIPNSVTAIGNSAFYKCSELTNINIPNAVTSIGRFAFFNCNSLNSVYSYANPENISMGIAVFEYEVEHSWEAPDYSIRTLYVLPGYSSLYEQDSNWYPYFGNIVEIATVSGDVDGDGNVTIGDVTNLIDLLLGGGVSVAQYPSADVDGDGNITIGDVTRIIDMLLYGN